MIIIVDMENLSSTQNKRTYYEKSEEERYES